MISYQMISYHTVIEAQAAAGNIVAVGEAGLDGMYGYSDYLLGAQEEVIIYYDMIDSTIM